MNSESVKRQPKMETPRRDGSGGNGNEARPLAEPSTPASPAQPALTQHLMEQVCDRMNLNRAYQRVVANQGAPGVDGMTVAELRDWLREHKETLIASLLDASYRPPPVRGVQIPKPGSVDKRQLGIPTAVDRLVQEAILQVLDPILDPTFSESSFGFRPGRSAHQALLQASQYVADGREWVVDIDLEKFFDRELEKRGLCFCRYADDCNIYVRSQKAGARVMASITRWLGERLKLPVNRKKSAVAQVDRRKFLGYRLLRNGWLTLAPSTIERLKDRIREVTRRNQAVPFGEVLKRLNRYLGGWFGYFQLARNRQRYEALDEWIRRKLRCLKLKQLKNPATIARFLMNLGVVRIEAFQLAYSGKGWWTRALTPQAHRAMSNGWLIQEGFRGLLQRYDAVKR